MWTVLESKDASKLLDKLPTNIAEKYDAWVALVRMSGPQALRSVKGFHDEKLSGQLEGKRSSRLNKQWRVIYTVEQDTVTVTVVNVDPHTYR